MTMKKIEIHGRDKDGNEYILNHLTALNTGASASMDRDVAMTKLKEAATIMASRWSIVFPHDKIFVAEVY